MPIELILFVVGLSIPVLIGYLHLNRYIAKRGDTLKKQTTFRIAVWIHAIAAALTILFVILSFGELYFGWGLNCYVPCLVVLSGIMIYLTLPKAAGHYLWWKIYSGVYYWGVAVLIPFWFFILFCMAWTFNSKNVYENTRYIINDISLGAYNPRHHTYVIYEKRGFCRKKLGNFTYDRTCWDLCDVRVSGKDAAVLLKERRADTLKMAKDSVLTIKFR